MRLPVVLSIADTWTRAYASVIEPARSEDPLPVSAGRFKKATRHTLDGVGR
jgi:hypothetical protein